MPRDATRGPLDGPAARLVALAVLLAAAGGLLAMHWRDLFPPERTAVAVDPSEPVARCIAERTGQIETMISENPAMAGRRQLFVERAVAMCRATEGGEGAPSLPAD